MGFAANPVTGGASFIGPRVTVKLLRGGHALRMLDNFSTGSHENLAEVGGDVELVEGDIRSYGRTQAITQLVDCVIHLGGSAVGAAIPAGPLTTNAVKVTGAQTWCSRTATPVRGGWSWSRLRL